MKTVEWNGEYWYENRDPLWQRLLCWLVWPGGWMRTDVAGQRRRFAFRRRDPTPLSLFGHRFTHFSWGWQLRVGHGWLVWSNYRRREPRKVYWSRDGTPGNATVWFEGAPPEVQAAVRESLDYRLGRERMF